MSLKADILVRRLIGRLFSGHHSMTSIDEVAKALCLTATLLLSCVESIAQGITPTATSHVEIAILKAQLETTKQFQDSFITMAQWTLGSAIAIALAMAVFGWFTNKANHERETKNLKLELVAELRDATNQAMEDLRSRLSERQKDIQSAVELSLERKIDKVRSDISSINFVLYDLQRSALQREANAGRAKGSHSWSAHKFAELLKLEAKHGTDHYHSGDTLDDLGALLKLDAVTLDSDAVNAVVGALGQMPEQHRATCDLLIARAKIALR